MAADGDAVLSVASEEREEKLALLEYTRSTNIEAEESGEDVGIEANAALELCGGFGPFQINVLLVKCLLMATKGMWYWIHLFVTQAPREVCIEVNGEKICHEGFPSAEECRVGKIVSAEGASFLTEFDLLCDGQMKIAMLQTTFVIAAIFGMLLISPMTDTYGRIRMMRYCLICQQVCAVVTMISWNYYVYLVGRALIGFVMLPTGTIIYVYTSETLGKDKRSLLFIATNGYYVLGVAVYSLYAYFIDGWRYIAALPTVAGFFIMWDYLRAGTVESPLWLASQKRFEDAQLAFSRIAMANGRVAPARVRSSVVQVEEERRLSRIEPDRTARIWDMPQLLHLVYTTLALVAMEFGICGLYLSAGEIGNVVVITGFSAVCEFVCVIVAYYIFQYFGWRRPVVTFFFVAFACTLLCGCLPFGFWRSGLGIVGKAMAYLVSSGGYGWFPECYMTKCRSHAFGYVVMGSKVMTTIIPIIIATAPRELLLPSYAVSFLIGSLVCLGLPETHNHHLPSCLEDLKVMRQSTPSYFPCIKK